MKSKTNQFASHNHPATSPVPRDHFLGDICNRPFAAKPSRGQLFIKLWAINWQISEMEKACRKYQNGQVWGPHHSRMRFYDSLNFSKKLEDLYGKSCWKARPCSPATFSIQILLIFRMFKLLYKHVLCNPMGPNLAIFVFSICPFHHWHSLSYTKRL